MPVARSGLVALAALLAATATAAPKSKGEQAIHYRHSVYHVIEWNIQKMDGVIDGKVPYDRDAFATWATRIALLAPMLPEGFPEGSYVQGKTDAKPEIWTNRAEFDDLMKKLAAKSATLADVAKGGDLARIRPAFDELTQACKNCHDKFKRND